MLEETKSKKLAELEKSNIPSKYRADLARKKINM